MAHSSSKPASICSTTCRSISARMKLSSSCRTPGSLVSNKIRWTSSRLKMDCGTAFQDRICKANYRSCLSLHEKKQHKATCPQKPSARCSSKSSDACRRHSQCDWFSRSTPQRKRKNDNCDSMNDEARTSNVEGNPNDEA